MCRRNWMFIIYCKNHDIVTLATDRREDRGDSVCKKPYDRDHFYSYIIEGSQHSYVSFRAHLDALSFGHFQVVRHKCRTDMCMYVCISVCVYIYIYVYEEMLNQL